MIYLSRLFNVYVFIKQSGPFIGILFVNMNCMQSVGHAFPATVLSVLRQGVLLIPLLFLLSAALGLNGVISGQSISDCVTVVLSVILWHKVKSSVMTESGDTR